MMPVPLLRPGMSRALILGGYGKRHSWGDVAVLPDDVYWGNVSEICLATRLMAPFTSCETPATPSEE